jgi:hypothetical protein
LSADQQAYRLRRLLDKHHKREQREYARELAAWKKSQHRR